MKTDTLNALEIMARFPEGQSVDVPAYLREHGNPDAAQDWIDMNEEHRDKFKSAAIDDPLYAEEKDEMKAASLDDSLTALALLATWEEGHVDEDDPRDHEGEGSMIPGLEEKKAAAKAKTVESAKAMFKKYQNSLVGRQTKKTWHDFYEAPVPVVEPDDLDLLAKMAKEDYPWEQCIKDQKANPKIKDPEAVCGKIKAESQGKKADSLAALEQLAQQPGDITKDTNTAEMEGMLARFQEGKPADPCKQPGMSESECAKWEQYKGKVEGLGGPTASGDDDKDARFEEGVPADPTENRSEDDKAKWQKYHGQIESLTASWGDSVGEKTAARVPSGLYGYKRAVQSSCEGSIKRLTKAATAVARKAYRKDENIPMFLATHAKRGGSLPAKILVAAMKGMGPRVAALVETGEKKAAYQVTVTWRDRPDMDGLQKQSGLEIEGYNDTGKVSVISLAAASEDGVRSQIQRIMKFPGVANAVYQGEAKTAAMQYRYGLYGYPSKTASLGLTSCAMLREAAGHVAAELHRRRAESHADITGFLQSHAKQARCLYSKLLHASYPDLDMRLASSKGVTEWLVWEE